MKKKNLSLQITRIVAMFSIILCHLIQEYARSPFVNLAQLFNVGVYIFLFLSGYLYGQKEIKNPLLWLIKRFIKLMIPLYLFMLFIFGAKIYCGTFELKYVFIYLFNLQRVLGTTVWAGHLWFMTVLMFCYLLTPLLNKVKPQVTSKWYHIAYFLIFSIITCFINEELGQILLYMFAYLWGYIYKNNENNFKINNLGIYLLFFSALTIRVLGHLYLDKTIIYNRMIVSITHLVLAFAIYLTITKIFSPKKPTPPIKILNHFDDLSYYLYIVHSIYMVGPLRLVGTIENFFLEVIIILLASYISSLLLRCLTNFINKILKV